MAPSIFTHIPSQKANKQKLFLKKKQVFVLCIFKKSLSGLQVGKLQPLPHPFPSHIHIHQISSSIYSSSFFPCISAWYINPKLEWLDTIEIYFFKFKQVLLIIWTVALFHAMKQGSIVSNTTLLSLPNMSSHSSQLASKERKGTWIIPCRGICFFNAPSLDMVHITSIRIPWQHLTAKEAGK